MKKAILLLVLIASVLSLKPLSSSAQLVITPSATAAALANKLVGNGVIIIAPILNCPSVANGIFQGPSSLSFDSGIVLTSGRAQSTGAFNVGAGGPASAFADNDNLTVGDPQLTVLAGQPTFDRCVLEFDFRPAGDTVKFNYVFGSEEYTNFTCSNFNDVFGFFISGPGYATPRNIALVPGTNVPVCINSVNNGPSGGYSISTCNAVGPGSPFSAYYVNNSAGTSITYDGITTTLQAIASVVPCDTYHLKIGIADGTDHAYDSGVFIEAGSLSSTGISVRPLGINSADTAYGGQYCVRGCLPGQFVFNISSPLAADMSIHYLVAGTAINGYDYTTIADSVVIPAGGLSTTLFIYPQSVTPATGPKTITLYILSPYSCGGVPTVIDSAVMTILDSFYVHIITPDTTICRGASLTLTTAGDTSLTYTWTPAGSLNSNTLLSPTASPSVTTTYTVSGVYASAGCSPSTDVITVTVVNPFTLDVGDSVQNTCVGIPLQLHLNVIATSAGNYIPAWTPNADLTGANTNNPIVTPLVAGDVVYYVSDTETASGCYATASFVLHVLPNDFMLLNHDTVMCFNGVVPMNVIGSTEFTYHWEPSSLVDYYNIMSPTATVSATTAFTVTASYPGCPDMQHSVNLIVEAPHVDILTKDTTFCVGDSIHVQVAAESPGSTYAFEWTPTEHLVDPAVVSPVFTSTVVGDFPFDITIISPHGCTSTDHIVLSPRPTAHITATATTSVVVNYGDQVQLDAHNLTPFPLIYWWTPNDGSLDNPNINNPIATLIDSTNYIVYAMNEWGCRDSAHVSIMVNDGTSEFIPTAFTPNGDGLNDVFRITNMNYQKLVMFNVYNRWGQLVYHNDTDPKKGWDGTFNDEPQDMGVYNYVIMIAKPGADGKQKNYKGEVTLIR